MDVDREKPSILTPRELELMEIIWDGIVTDNKGIALLLRISTQTVKNHFNSIYQKLEIGDGQKMRTEKTRALITCIQLGILPDYEPTINEMKVPIVKY